MDGEEMEDVHMCLVCQATFMGLMNYVNHKKYDCPGRKNTPAPQISNSLNNHDTPAQAVLNHSEFSVSTSSDNLNQNYLNSPPQNLKVGTDLQGLGSQNAKNLNITSLNQGLLSPPSSSSREGMRGNNISVDIHDSFPNFAPVAFSPSTSHAVDPNMVINTKENLDRTEDFFSSLALQSKSNIKDPVSSQTNSVGNLLRMTFDKDTTNENELPITNILNSINFSDDDLEFDEDLLEEAFSDESEEDIPPSNYTRGKWKPGCGPGRPRESGGKWGPGQKPPQICGKWKPGQSPTGGKWKSYGLRSTESEMSRSPRIAEKKMKRMEQVSRGKKIRIDQDSDEYLCKPCAKYFKNRFTYSNHCATSIHKRNVQASKFSEDESGSDTEIEEELVSNAGEEQQSATQHMENLCKDCNTHFDNADLLSNHFSSGGCGNRDNEAMQNGDAHDKYMENDKPMLTEDGRFLCRACGISSEEMSWYSVHREDPSHILKLRNLLEEDSEASASEVSKGEDQNLSTSHVGSEEKDFSKQTKEKKNLDDSGSQKNTDQERENKPATECGTDTTKEVADDAQKGAADDDGNFSTLDCNICDKKFYSKYVMTRHLLSRTHKSRLQGLKIVSETLPLLSQYLKYIVRLSPYQCGPCQFYFNKESDLKSHIATVEHAKQLDSLTGEAICSLCKFSSHSNDEMLEHFQNNLLHETLKKKSRKICVIKEKNYKAACKFCKKKIHSRVHMKRHVQHKHMVNIDSKGQVVGRYEKHEDGRFQCGKEACSKKFKTYNAFILHMNRKHRQDLTRVTCRICNKVFSDRYSYGKHCIGNLHKRNLSKRQYAVGQNLIKADEDVDDEEVSNEIRKKFNQLVNNSTKRTYVRRKRGRPPGENSITKVFKCDHCEYTVNIYSDLRPHYLEVHSNHILVCDMCDITFLSEKALKLHTSSRQHQANLEELGMTGSTKVFPCDICSKCFMDEATKQWHIDVRHLHPNSEESLRKTLGKPDLTSAKYKEFLKEVDTLDRGERTDCIECKRHLKKESILEHLRTHTGDKPFVCRYCKSGFMSALSLRRHLMSHLGLTERKCEICGKEFKKLESYKEHMKCHEMERSGARKLMCEVCAMEFFLPKQLRAHMRRHGEKKFKCEVENCHWTFYFAGELEAHMKTHNKARPFLCDICGYAAGTRNRLNRHHRTHTGERNYHCDYCDYKAGTRTHLRRHMRIHIGTKPYKCPYCEYSCNTHENIRKHIMKTKKHEGLYIYNCNSCRFGANTVNEFRAHLQALHPDLYDQSRSMEGLASLTGLYVKQEDLSKPTEGMKINPVKERRERGPKRTKAQQMLPAKKVKEEYVNIEPLYIHEEVVQNFNNEEEFSRNWQQTTQMELDQAVKVVQAEATEDFSDNRPYTATVENLMILDPRRGVEQQELLRQQVQKTESSRRANPEIPIIMQGFVEFRPQQM